MPLALDAQQALWINFPTSLIRLLHLTAAAATSTRPTREHASTLCTVSRSLQEGRMDHRTHSDIQSASERAHATDQSRKCLERG